MLDLIAHGAAGLGPVHLLLTSAAEIGFGPDGVERGWIGSALAPLWMFSGPFQYFQSAILEAWQPKVSAQLADGKGAQFLDIPGSSQLLTSSLLRERDTMLIRSIMCG